MKGFCVSNLNVSKSYSIKRGMFKHLCLKEARFIELELQRKDWLIQNSVMFFYIVLDDNLS